MCVWLAASSLLMESMYGKDGGIIVISISSNYMCVCVCVCVFVVSTWFGWGHFSCVDKSGSVF